LADQLLIGIPSALAVLFILLAAAGLTMRAAARCRYPGTAGTQCRDALLFSAGAGLLAAFFLFNAGFFFFMG
jgi:hypothetical protein